MLRRSTRCYAAHISPERISQRDLRQRSKEIMDAVERGEGFTVTRDGQSIGELVPLRRQRRFVSRAEFAAGSRTTPTVDADALRSDLDDAFGGDLDDPYAR